MQAGIMGGASSCEGELWWRSGRWSSGGSGGGFAGSGIGIVVGGTIKAARAVLSKRELSMARALFANLVRRLLSCEAGGPRATHPEGPATTDADRDRGL